MILWVPPPDRVAPVELKMAVVLRLGVMSVLVTSMSACTSTTRWIEASAARSCASAWTTTDAGAVIAEPTLASLQRTSTVPDDLERLVVLGGQGDHLIEQLAAEL